MLIEAFSQGKDPAAPEANEDQFVLLPGRAFAVIDGVTDRLGSRYDGMLAGRYAAVTVKAALERALSAQDAPLNDAPALVSHLTQELAQAYGRHGILEKARANAEQRFSATLALVTFEAADMHVTLVGDSGVRVNGSEVLQVDKDLDRITATLRRQAWPSIAAATADPLLRERLSRLVSFHGLAKPAEGLAPYLTPADIALIEAKAVAANVALLPHVPRRDIENLVRGGIVNAQGGYQNDASSVLGYSCLDGFEVPFGLVLARTFSQADVRTLELFSDGYFKHGDGFGVAAWERAFAEAERDDPEKIGRHMSVKGSTSLAFADDRTYVGVRF